MKTERLYGSVDPIYFCLWKPDGTGLITGVTLDAGDMKISKNGGAFVNVTGAFAEIGLGLYKYTPAAADLQSKVTVLTFIDAEGICLDHCHIIETYGDVNAQHTQEIFELDDIADAIADEVYEGSATHRQMIRGIFASVVNKLAGATGPTTTMRDMADTKNRITATVDDDGNRTAVVTDLT